MKSSLQKEVNGLMYGEGASAAGFAVLWIITAIIDEEARVYLQQPLFIAPFLTICIILATGSYFWSIMSQHIKNRQRVILTDQQHRRFRWLHRLIIAAIVISTIFIAVQLPLSRSELFLIMLIYGFMWLEYINYFHIRLSYLSPREFKQLIIHRKPTRSHLSRALRSK
ncbi:hypothetical protein [Macrococcus lamae]|uniref:hypothetical protein n=1 Tax=Macrococcus lamae TaxID=198484 RepID=UPI00140A52AE|nr:hypothetical protein [Macrococcus lamae]